MNVTPLAIPEVRLIEPKVFPDERGYFLETYAENRYRQVGVECAMVQHNHSFSVRGVVRGLHYQLGSGQAKLITVTGGEIWDVAVDLRLGSPTFGKHVATVLSVDNRRQLFIPIGFAHGFVALSDAHVHYSCSAYYDPSLERGVAYNDPALSIPWPEDNPIVSPKDLEQPLLKDIGVGDLPVHAEKVTLIP